VDSRGVGPVHLGQRRAQRVAVLGDQDQIDVVGHQHPAPHGDTVRGAMHPQQLAIGGVVRIAEKRPLPSVAALREVVGNTGNHEPRQPSHRPDLPRIGRRVARKRVRIGGSLRKGRRGV
jgi:hypothetical protein